MTAGSPYRLPRTVTPSHYGIELRLDPDEPTFDGTEDVAITVHEAVTEIAINGKDLTVHTGTVLGSDGTSVEIAKAVPDPSARPDHARAAGGARGRRLHASAVVHRQAERPDGGDVPVALHG